MLTLLYLHAEFICFYRFFSPFLIQAFGAADVKDAFQLLLMKYRLKPVSSMLAFFKDPQKSEASVYRLHNQVPA